MDWIAGSRSEFMRTVRLLTFLLSLVSLLPGLDITAQMAMPGDKTGGDTARSASSVPRVVKYTAALPGAVSTDSAGGPAAGSAAMTFAVYTEQNGGTALWSETQTVSVDAAGKYSVLLGSNTAAGVPQEVFSTGEARWLGVQVAGQAE